MTPGKGGISEMFDVTSRNASLPAPAQLEALDDLITILRGYFMLLGDVVSLFLQIGRLLGLRNG